MYLCKIQNISGFSELNHPSLYLRITLISICLPLPFNLPAVHLLSVCLKKALEHWCWCQCIISLIWRKYHVHTWIYVPGCARHTPFRLISPPLFEFQSATVSSVYLLAYLLLAYLLACLHISTHPCMRPSVHASMNIPNWTVVMHQSIHLFIYQSICPSISSFFAFLNISHCISWSVLINRIMLN